MARIPRTPWDPPGALAVAPVCTLASVVTVTAIDAAS